MHFFGAPDLGSPERAHPNLFRFIPIKPPFSSDLFRFVFLVFGNTPICSDLLRFLPISSDFFSERLRTNQETPLSADPFCKSPTFQTCTLFSANFRPVWPVGATKPPHHSFPCQKPPPLCCFTAKRLSDIKWTVTSTKKGQVVQKVNWAHA